MSALYYVCSGKNGSENVVGKYENGENSSNTNEIVTDLQGKSKFQIDVLLRVMPRATSNAVAMLTRSSI